MYNCKVNSTQQYWQFLKRLFRFYHRQNNDFSGPQLEYRKINFTNVINILGNLGKPMS